MEKDNWEVGDIAICIDNKRKNSGQPPPLKLYGEYIVNAMQTCPSCGVLVFDIGIASQGGTSCGCNKLLSGEVHWAYASRFVKKQTKEMVQMELNAAVEAENYELAQILKERLEAV